MRTDTEQAILVLNRAITRAANHYDAAGPYGKSAAGRNNFIGTIRAAAGYNPESWIAKGESPSAPSGPSPLASPSVLSLCFFAIGRTVRSQVVPDLKRMVRSTSTELANFCELVSLIPHGVGPVNLHTKDGFVKVLKDTVERLHSQLPGNTIHSVPSVAAANAAKRAQEKLRKPEGSPAQRAIRGALHDRLEGRLSRTEIDRLAKEAWVAAQREIATDLRNLADGYDGVARVTLKRTADFYARGGA